MRAVLVSAIALACTACSATVAPQAASESVDSASSLPQQESIGAAAMDKKGVITLYLSLNHDGVVGDAILRYKPGDPDYKGVLEHVGPLKPGESRAVYPWPKKP